VSRLSGRLGGVIRGYTVLGVIPARGGSKRFPGKNLASFRGRPLIAWTIKAAQASAYIDTLICSTDSDDIEIAALLHGCLTLRRPDELSTDTATSEDVLRHALIHYPADFVVLLQPTSPLRTTEDIDACIHMMEPVVSYRENGSKNGAVYVCPSRWLKRNDFTSPHAKYFMSNQRSLDIDYPEDVGLQGYCQT